MMQAAGFVAAGEEARELVASAGGDGALLDELVGRRLTGEPLAWITGSVRFCGVEVRVDPGVYVPRWHSEPLARRAVERLPADGTAIDLGTGSGAIAKTLHANRPGARVAGSDIDERAVACATANGVEAYLGDLFAPVPPLLKGRVDVVVGVVPYVPTSALPLLQRDTFTFESPLSLRRRARRHRRPAAHPGRQPALPAPRRRAAARARRRSGRNARRRPGPPGLCRSPGADRRRR